MSKVVFVGNVPYNMGEEQLIDVFKSVGQVIGFRLVFDRDTGKPRGYGFCEFADHETAQSAVRNLNNVDVGGRPLRIDLADSDPFLEGKTTVRGELVDSGEGRPHWRDRDRDEHRGPPKHHDSNAFLATLPPGVSVPPGSSSLDTISQTLATMNPDQLMEVLAQMKAFVITHPEQARSLLIARPQLAYALFQALLLNNIVKSEILQRMLAATSNSAAASAAGAAPPPPHQPPMPSLPYQQVPPLHQPQPVMPPLSMSAPSAIGTPNMYQQHVPPPSHMPPQSSSYYRPPPPAQPQPAATSAPAQAPMTTPELSIDPAQRHMLMTVLSLTQEQINALPPAERDAVQHLRNSFMGITA